MVSLTQWTWVWVNSGSWWWTGRPSVLQSMGSQRVGHDWAELKHFLKIYFLEKYLFLCIYLAVPGLSCSTWDVRSFSCGIWPLIGFSMRDLVPSLGFEPRLLTLGVLATEPPGKHQHILKNFLTSDACLYPMTLPSGCVHVAVVAVQSLSRVWLFVTPMDYSLPGSSVHGISQAKILEWVAIFFSRGSSQPRGRTHDSCIGRWVLYYLSHQGSLAVYMGEM